MARIFKVSLSIIEDVDEEDLDDERLNTLLYGYNSFDDVLNDSTDPITLDGSTKPFEITDGRHRVYLAREEGYSHVPALVFLSEAKVKQFIIGKARQAIYEQFNNTADFANGDAFINHVNWMFNQYVGFWITHLEVIDLGHKRQCKYGLDCEIGNDAKDDLSLLGVGIKGSLLIYDDSQRW